MLTIGVVDSDALYCQNLWRFQLVRTDFALFIELMMRLSIGGGCIVEGHDRIAIVVGLLAMLGPSEICKPLEKGKWSRSLDAFRWTRLSKGESA